jgi:CubicO group peptidase (beta-lactamase class C family)
LYQPVKPSRVHSAARQNPVMAEGENYPMKRSLANKLFALCCTLVILISLTGWRSPARADLLPTEAHLTAIDSFVIGQMERLDIPGLALAVVRSGDVLVARGYGMADSSGRPVTAQTPFLAASLSKSITALGVMQLVEAGKLDLDAPVQDLLPWLQTADPAAGAQITPRQLLHHTSGFSQFEGDLRNLEKDRGEQALETSLRRLSETALIAAPGEQFEYSNTNYDLLGLLIQTISGKPYATYIQEEIFTPLGMEHSYTSFEAARQAGLASGYAAFFGLTLPYDRWMPTSETVVPSAGLFLSAEDLARYLALHLQQGRTQAGKPLVSPAGMAQLHTPGAQIGPYAAYAMGWNQFEFPQAAPAGAAAPLALSHGGDWANYKALMLLIPEYELGVAVLMNKQDWGHESAYEQIGWNTALLSLGLPRAEFPVNEDFLTRYGRIVGGALVLVLIVGLIGAARRSRNANAWEAHSPQRRRQALIFLLILPLIDLALAGYLLLVELGSLANLRLSLAFFPDAGLLYLAMLALTLGWGTLRTILAVKKLRPIAPAGTH